MVLCILLFTRLLKNFNYVTFYPNQFANQFSIQEKIAYKLMFKSFLNETYNFFLTPTDEDFVFQKVPKFDVDLKAPLK